MCSFSKVRHPLQDQATVCTHKSKRLSHRNPDRCVLADSCASGSDNSGTPSQHVTYSWSSSGSNMPTFIFCIRVRFTARVTRASVVSPCCTACSRKPWQKTNLLFDPTLAFCDPCHKCSFLHSLSTWILHTQLRACASM